MPQFLTESDVRFIDAGASCYTSLAQVSSSGYDMKTVFDLSSCGSGVEFLVTIDAIPGQYNQRIDFDLYVEHVPSCNLL